MMKLFQKCTEMGHEQVVFCNQPEVGLRAIIAIHNTTLGPALGGCRMWTYETLDDAITDVLRLSRGMTYKAAVSGLNLGGGKAVILGNPKTDKTEALFRAFGRFVESLNGRYITAEDVGTDVNDMEYVFAETNHVVGVARVHGGSGDPSPFTARGVFHGMRATVEVRLPGRKLADLSVAVQGVGHVGAHLVRLLHQRGVRKIFVCDIDEDRVSRIMAECKGVEAVPPDQIYDVACDIFAPCALGAVINPETVERLKCSIIAGAANNQLSDDSMAEVLQKRNILYAPDYAINAGGLMNVYIELEGYNQERALRMVEKIYDNLMNIFRIADRDGITTAEAADRAAEERMRQLAFTKRFYLPRAGRRNFPGRLSPPNGG